MQIYTKILIGMAVGTAVGLTLGPTSALLDKDLYVVPDAARESIYVHRDDPEPVKLPNVPLELHAVEVVTGSARDKQGREHTVPEWVRVRFEITDQLGLLDRDTESAPEKSRPGQAATAGGAGEAGGAGDEEAGDGPRPGPVARAFGKKTGDTVEAWLKMRKEPLRSGVVTSPEPVSALGHTVISWVSPVGAVFMRLITMVIVPLVFASLLVGVASLGDVRKLGRLGGKTIGLYLVTTAVAVSIGLACALIVKPGRFVAEEDRVALQSQFAGAAEERSEKAAEAPSAVDNILDIIPTNPVASLSGGNMLQIIFFALVFGIALTLMGAQESQLVVTFFDKVQQAMVIIIHMVMAVAPFGVAALLAEVVGTSGLSVLGALLVYALVVLLGLALHVGIVYGGLIRLLTKFRLRDFYRAIRPAQLVAFSTSSSSATLPVSMDVAEENLRVSGPVASFVLPLGATVNMDGTALYQGVAAIFIAQVFNQDLTVGAQLGIVLTATMASIGAAGVPGAGMITLTMVLTAAGIPAVGVALILGVDRLLDMFRTTVNVTGDLTVAAVIAASEGEEIRVPGSAEDRADPSHGLDGRLEREPEADEPAPPDG